MELGISGGIGLLFGCLLAWLALRSRTAALQARLSLTEKELAAAKADLARLLAGSAGTGGEPRQTRICSRIGTKDQQRKDRVADESWGSRRTDLQNAFKALAADALKSNNSSFLQIAQETLKRFQSEASGDLDARQKAVADLVTPVRESLSKVDAQIQQMEIARGEAYGDLKAQVQSLITHAKRTAIRNRQPGARAAHSERARALGRNPTAARGRDCGHAVRIATLPSRKR